MTESDFKYRMNNMVQQRLKDALKRQIMQMILSEGYFYLDKQDFLEALQEIKDDLVKPQ